MLLSRELKKTGDERIIETTKLPNSRIGIGLKNVGKSVVISYVVASSPLEGKVFPGDIIRLSGDGRSSTRGPTLTNPGADAKIVAEAFYAASHLMLSVETPSSLANAESVFLLHSEGEELGIQLDKCPVSGRARVSSLAPNSVAATRVSRHDLSVGDLIVACSEEGILHEVASAKDGSARLSVRSSGAMEIRVVKPGENQPPCNWSRPSSARSSRADTAEALTAEICMPPDYAAAIAV